MTKREENVYEGTDPCTCGHPLSAHDHYLQNFPGKFPQACGASTKVKWGTKEKCVEWFSCECRNFTVEPLFYVASFSKHGK